MTSEQHLTLSYLSELVTTSLYIFVLGEVVYFFGEIG